MKNISIYGRRLRPAMYALGAIALSACSVNVAHAQFRTSIQGTVTDPSGAVIPNVTLTLKDIQTNQVRTINSDASGVFSFQALPADHFVLTVTGAGFKKKVYSDLTFIPEQANSLLVQLDLGGTDTVVNVDASSEPVIDTQTSNIGATISANTIQHMPSFNGDVFTLSQLAPGAVATGAQSAGGGVYTQPGNQGPGGSTAGQRPTENGAQVNSNGQGYQNNAVSIDGISTVSAVWGGTTIITPTPEAVDNIRIVTNDYDAEDGRFAGAQTLVTSKSGTNQLHGSAFLSIYRPGLNAYNRRIDPAHDGSITPIRNNNQYNYYGGSLGGPLWKDKVFAFFAFESSPKSVNTQSQAWYETAAFRNAAPAGSIARTYMTFPGNAPQGTLASQPSCTSAQVGLAEGVTCRTVAGGLDLGSPLTNGLGNQDPTATGLPSAPGVGNGLDGIADVALYNTVNPTNSYYRQFAGRVDANVTSRDHVSFTMYWVPQGSTTYSGGTRTYQLYNHNQINQAMAGIWNHTFNPTFVNEARANVAGWRWNEITDNPQLPLGLPVANIAAFGSATPSQFGPSVPSHLNQWTISYKDVATKTLGAHTIKFGADETSLHYLQQPTAVPNYGFYNMWTFLNDAPDTESGNFNPLTGIPGGSRQDQRENLWGAFLQDDWKVMPTLTLHAGLRYSYFGALTDKQNDLNAVRIGDGTTGWQNLRIAKVGGLWNPQKLNFGPQLGFNWAPSMFNNKLVIRGGYGLSFNQNEIAITANTSYNPGASTYYNFAFTNPSTPGTGANILYATSSSPTSLTGYPANPHAKTTFNTNGLQTAGSANIIAFGDGKGNLPTIYVEHYSLDAQYQLPAQIVASVGYQGSVSRHLINHMTPNSYAVTRGYTLNQLVTSGDYWVNDGSANNNSLLLEAKRNMNHGLSLDAQFALAKSMDTDGSGPYYEDPYYPVSPASSYGPSDFNINKSAKVFGTWQPVFFHGDKRWVEKIAGGWSVSGIYSWHTGFPWSPTYSLPSSLYCNNCGYSTIRPYYKGGAGKSQSNDSFINGTNFNNYAAAATAGAANAPTKTINGTALTPYAYDNAYFNIPDQTNALTWQSQTAAVTPNVSLPVAAGARRNQMTGPSYRNVDMTIAKAFGMPNTRLLGDKANLEIRANALNVFNLLNLNPSNVNNNITLSNFGTDVTALSGRQLSFTARFSF
ncbi:carboxypeptidase regulatory-like domain-containing protein [Granulicella cerasi]|uniref:Carboxypeptidase regulatory-like domain-containing protein n=1 Tax=Granulicella cerasi TaxID=741063 RepID=A0ABW1Z4X2_9BACT|nr:TonB-dependent receptor [Granulicella cerasi]